MFKIFEVLKQGKALSNSATWKNVGGATIALTVVLNASIQVVKMFIDLPDVPDELILKISGAISATVCFYLNYATSDKVGFKETEK